MAQAPGLTQLNSKIWGPQANEAQKTNRERAPKRKGAAGRNQRHRSPRPRNGHETPARSAARCTGPLRPPDEPPPLEAEFNTKPVSCLFRTLLQLLRFGVSGILGIAVSTLLFYGLKGRLPDLFWVFWIYRLDNPRNGVLCSDQHHRRELSISHSARFGSSRSKRERRRVSGVGGDERQRLRVFARTATTHSQSLKQLTERNRRNACGACKFDFYKRYRCS